MPEDARESSRITVLPWPHGASSLQHACNEGAIDDDDDERARTIIAIGVTTPITTIRHIARDRIRNALRQALAILLDLSPESVPLISVPGQPIRVALANEQIGLSISHQPGLSVAAINLRGSIGIDVMRPETILEWQQIAQDYLGVEACARIGTLPENQQTHAFAQEWTRYEASLKCLGLGINEWHPAQQKDLRRCSVMQLILTNDLMSTMSTMSTTSIVGAVATLA